MIIKPFYFLWRQLRGPQITAIVHSVFEWIIKEFDTIFSYFYTFSIDTANNDHLSFLGLISGFSRALVSIPNQSLFWFTNGRLHNNDHGFSDLHQEVEGGGRLSDITEDRVAERTSRLPFDVYRKLLKTYVTSDGTEGSLVLLDDLSETAWNIYQRRELGYGFTISAVQTNNISPGDITVNLGAMSMWQDGNLIIRAIYEAIENSFYKPEPRLLVNMDEGGEIIEAENGSRLTTEDNRFITMEV